MATSHAPNPTFLLRRLEHLKAGDLNARKWPIVDQSLSFRFSQLRLLHIIKSRVSIGLRLRVRVSGGSPISSHSPRLSPS